MSAQHTPGPWRVGGGTGLLNQLAIEPSIGCAYGKGNEVEANARLMAAAPELLKACRMALYALKGREHDQFLRDAIAKATGRAA